MAMTNAPAPVGNEDTLKYLTSMIDSIGGWLRYQDGKATALSAILGVGLLDVIKLTETTAFADQTGPYHLAVAGLFWIALVAGTLSIVAFAVAIFPSAPKSDTSPESRSPKSLFYWRYVAEKKADTLLTEAVGAGTPEMCKHAAEEGAALADTLLAKVRIVRTGWILGLIFFVAWLAARILASI